MRYTINTDAISMTLDADDRDHAARLFAASEGIEDIVDAIDLQTWAEDAGGWINIIEN